MLVTPLRDGMNLVSKEYVASRPDERGTLVLSEFTGAIHELRKSAIVINPYDVDGLAAAMLNALNLPRDEQRRRMRAMRRVVSRRDVFRWANSFLEALAA
jgi:trehalose-6-phosphate synthase